HVQKDKRATMGSHMEKCVFIGYPPGYKGWKFYNPVTKHVVISERAEFDERYFPCSKDSKGPAVFSLVLPSISSQTPDLGGDRRPSSDNFSSDLDSMQFDDAPLLPAHPKALVAPDPADDHLASPIPSRDPTPPPP